MPNIIGICYASTNMPVAVGSIVMNKSSSITMYKVKTTAEDINTVLQQILYPIKTELQPKNQTIRNE